MKRTAYLLGCFMVAGMSLAAQQKQKPATFQSTHAGIDLERFTMDLSFETGLPILNMKGSSVGPGLAYHLGYVINDKLNASGNIGYDRFFGKGKNGSGTNYQYYLLGAGYFIKAGVHIDAFLGYASFKGTYTIPLLGGAHSFNNKGIAFAAGGGYKINKAFDVSLRFQKSSTVSFIGLSLAVRFDQ